MATTGAVQVQAQAQVAVAPPVELPFQAPCTREEWTKCFPRKPSRESSPRSNAADRSIRPWDAHCAHYMQLFAADTLNRKLIKSNVSQSQCTKDLFARWVGNDNKIILLVDPLAGWL